MWAVGGQLSTGLIDLAERGTFYFFFAHMIQVGIPTHFGWAVDPYLLHHIP